MTTPAVNPPADPVLERARALLRERFGHEDFRPGQEDALRSVFADRNVLAVMPTGSGKSLLYQLPALLADGLTLVVSPLIALMKDQVDELQRRGLPASFVNSSLSFAEQQARLQACVRGEIKLLYVAPERFRSGAFLNMLQRVRVARMAVDEAHCISEWGHDFRPDYRRLKEGRAVMGDPRVSALTATATARVQQDIVAALGLDPGDVDVHVHGFDRPNLQLSVRRVSGDEDKFEAVKDVLREAPGCGIIYAGTRRAAEGLVDDLKRIEPSTVLYHAGLAPDARARAQEVFLGGKARLVVATVAFGMGIDKPDVRFVVHYHYPGSVEQYYQEIGRAGRDGKPSRCVLLHSPADRYLREFFIDLNYPPREVVAEVYDLLWEIDENPVLRTYEEIARLGDDIKDGQVGASLRLLEEAGAVRALTSGGAAATVGIERPGAELLAQIRGALQKRVFEALAVAADLEEPGWYQVGLRELAAAAGIDEDQVRRALAALAAGGVISYEPPFRGRGVEKLLDPPPPFKKLVIDWTRHDFLRGLEEEKLATMEEFIRTRQCRRGFILRYFGEREGFRCGECDRCRSTRGDGRLVQAVPPGAAAEGQALRPEAEAVLLCIANLHFPLGADKVAAVVTGSRAKDILRWKLDRNPAYNRAGAKKEAVRWVIDDLLAKGYVEQQGDPKRPVLALTERGVEAIGGVEPAALEGAVATATPAKSDHNAICEAVLRAVAAVRPPLGVGKLAALLGGSAAAWIGRTGLDDSPFHGAVNATQKDIAEVIKQMLRKRLVQQDRSSEFPVLKLSAAGERERAALAERPEEPPPRQRAAPLPQPAVTPPRAAEPLEVVLAPPIQPSEAPAGAGNPETLLAVMIEQLLHATRETAPPLVDKLGLFHPRAVAAALKRAVEAGDDVQRLARAVWAAGEICGVEAQSFLARTAQSSAAEVRRHTVTAVAKILRQVQQPSDQPPADSLLALLRASCDDADAEVARRAQRALAE